ncbi:MAG: glycosyltransferase family 4 protein [Thermodesulfobacteriota bacterium]|nr:glycosyltransferase family 4 protein [Thermodesulfobacteriota bacterium]
MSSIKIATVIPAYGLLGGAEGFAFEVTERIAARSDFDMHVFANKWRAGKAPVTFHKVPVIRFPRWAIPISFALNANRQIATGGFDLIHSHERLFEMDIFSFHGIPHLYWRKNVRKKPPGLFDLATAWVEKKGITGKRLQKIMPVSSLVATELSKMYPDIEPKIQVCHPGVSSDQLNQYDRDQCRNDIRKQYGFTDKDIVGLFVGMNFEVKGLDLVIEGYSRLMTQTCNDNSAKHLKLLVVGRGNRHKFMAMAEKRGIAEAVIFAGPTDDVTPFYLAGDFFVMPSVYDTFGLVVLEAMAAGLPVIISGNVGAKDLVDHDVQGFILPPNPTPADMAGMLSRILSPETRALAAQHGRERAARQTWDRLADFIVNLYIEISGRSRKKHTQQ